MGLAATPGIRNADRLQAHPHPHGFWKDAGSPVRLGVESACPQGRDMKFDGLMEAIASIHHEAAGRAAQTVNRALVLRNWMIGRSIVEFEQGGEGRAVYGERLLTRLSQSLKSKGVPGSSRQELGRYRRLYTIYPQLGNELRPTEPVDSGERALDKKIRPTVSVKSEDVDSARLLCLSWSHLTELLQLENPAQRRFYELQCVNGSWSVRELQRQIGSLLYERTGLSTDKDGLLAEARTKAQPQSLAELIRKHAMAEEYQISRAHGRMVLGVLRITKDVEGTIANLGVRGQFMSSTAPCPPQESLRMRGNVGEINVSPKGGHAYFI